MKLNEIPMEERTETTCINRMRRAIKTGTLDQMHEVLELIPKKILITAYVRAYISEFQTATLQLLDRANQISLVDIPLKARTETRCIHAMRLAITMDGLTSLSHASNVLELIPKGMLITAFIRANINEFN
jgi:hypothetical protein